ncbi:MAG: hypothetical protein J7M38_14510, partial [Armatimonadetes bacterium]|nr:hypothetical protein [Armatimonadota bacterium]
MRRPFLALALLSLTACAHAQRPHVQVLFDFEDGIEGWWGNVWGGAGECAPSLSDDAYFGKGALRCEISGVEKGSNVVCPWLAPDADWRQWEWGVISFRVKGDGTPHKARLIVETGLEGTEGHLTYTFSVPLDSTEWRQVRAPVKAFWNREKVPMDTRRIGRLMFGSAGTHTFLIDHIALEAPQRPVPLELEGAVEDLDLAPRMLQFADGDYALVLDPTPLGETGADISGNLTVGRGEGHEFLRKLPAGPPAGEVFIELPAPEQSGPATLSLSATRG